LRWLAFLGVRYRGLPELGEAPKPDSLDVNFARSLGPDYWEKRRGVFDFQQEHASSFKHTRLKTYIDIIGVTFKGPAVRVEPIGSAAQVAGTLKSKAGGAIVGPAVIAHKFGKGSVVYLAAGFDAAYYLYAYPYERLIVSEAIRWAAAGRPPVEVEAPMCVHATVMRQSLDGERLVVHLFNDVNTTAFHARPDDDVPLREETIPIHDIRVTFAPTYQLGRVHIEPGDQDLDTRRTPDGGMAVTVPRLDVHAMVVGELSAARKVAED